MTQLVKPTAFEIYVDSCLDCPEPFYHYKWQQTYCIFLLFREKLFYLASLLIPWADKSLKFYKALKVVRLLGMTNYC